jgi:hypothetical protein
MLRYFTGCPSYQEIAATLGAPRRCSAGKRRTGVWEAIVEEVLSTGNAASYAADCSPDVLVEAPSLGYRKRGIADHRHGVEETAAAGVRL